MPDAETLRFIIDVRAAVAVLDNTDYSPKGNAAYGNCRKWIIDNAERIARTLAEVEA